MAEGDLNSSGLSDVDLCSSESEAEAKESPSALDTNDQNTKATLKLEIPKFSESESVLSEGIVSPVYNIADLPWTLYAEIHVSERTGVKYLAVYVCCNEDSESTLWSCHADCEIRIKSQTPDKKDHKVSTNCEFEYDLESDGFPKFMRWNKIMEQSGRFINEKGVLTLEANVTVKKVTGVWCNPSNDFLSHQPNKSDVVLVVEDKRLHVCKMYLGLHSPFFHTMFFSDFAEREKEEVKLEDVKFEQFLELLKVIYPSRHPINSDNVEFLLELGDKFNISYVMNQCEHFLIGDDELKLIDKLFMADKYSLSKLHDCCLKMLKKSGDIKALKTDFKEKFNSLNHVTKTALLEKIFKLV